MKVEHTTLKTKFGIFDEYLFYNDTEQIIVLCMGRVDNEEDVFVRVHSHCISSHIFNSIECDCSAQMQFAQHLISNENKGLIIWLDQEGKSNGHLAKMRSNRYKLNGFSQEDAYEKCGYKKDARKYDLIPYILNYFKINSIQLITNHERKFRLIESCGVKITKIIHTPKINEEYEIFTQDN